uniref:Uncharacterized protein n=1 Tax=Nephroselmis olivacea TaxID=31312 RepID=Q9TKV0_NEPOL|nr:hypothetical protein NeolCp121 [Nephroselmis olivacea]AAD54897.1 unknown [Nephroselmis olivacea]
MSPSPETPARQAEVGTTYSHLCERSFRWQMRAKIHLTVDIIAHSISSNLLLNCSSATYLSRLESPREQPRGGFLPPSKFEIVHFSEL